MNLLKLFTGSTARYPVQHFVPMVCCAAFALSASAVAHADDASCAPLRKVEAGMMHLTYHQITQVTGQSPHEMISTPAAIYIKTPAGWLSTGDSPATRARLGHMFGISLTDCHLLRTESVDGHAAEVYAMTSHDNSGSSTQAQIWLAKSNRLPLKVEADVRTGSTTRHVSTLLDYDNVQVPANVKREFSLDSLFGRHH